jgi:1-acyl-sn-glycerol-3-phosphate acyltransferase
MGVLITIFLFIFTAICTPLALIYGVLFPKTQILFIRWWSGCFCKVLGLKIQVQGLENLPKNGPNESGVLFLFNHLSLLDIPVLHASLPVNFRFGAKSELFKIPVFGTMLNVMGILPITRQDQKKVAALYDKSVARIHNGESFILAPEGTRNPKSAIGPFKSGPFIFAIQAKAPLVPIVISGLERCMPKQYFFADLRYRNAIVKVLPKVETKNYDFDSRHKLKDLMHETFVKEFANLQATTNNLGPG